MRVTITTLALLVAALHASSAAAQSPPAQQRPQTVGEYGKNIQALTDLKDSTIKMARAINDANFEGKSVVTCNTCHRGSPKPVAAPSPWNKTVDQLALVAKLVQVRPGDTALLSAPPTPPAVALPSVEQVMAKYRDAVGTRTVTSIHLIGRTDALRGTRDREMSVEFPDKVRVSTTAQGGIVQVVNGDHGSQTTSQGQAPLPPGGLASLKSAAQLYLPVKFQQSTAARAVTAVESVGGRSYYVVESVADATAGQGFIGVRPGLTKIRLLFDVETGLLYKRVVVNQSIFGPMPDETTFEDYRKVNGVMMPFRITDHYMEDEQMFTISKIELNVTIDPKLFEAPPPKTGK